jgi:MFS family permease
MEQLKTKKTIKIFAAASFLNDLGSNMIYPVWPLFVTGVLNADMAVLGFIDGLGNALVSISQAISGYISDRIKKRKVFIWWGYLLGSISRVGYALSTVWQHLIPFRILDRAGKIRGAPRDAIIADISKKAERGKNFGLLKTMDKIGGVCGIVICILFFRLLGYRDLFLLAAIPSVIGVLLILFFIKESKSTDIRISKKRSLKHLDRNLKLFLLLSSIFALGSFSYSFLLIYAKRFGFQVTFVPVLYLIFTAAASVFSLPFGKLSDKIGRKPLLIISYILWGFVCAGFIFFRDSTAIVLTFILYGMHQGALKPVQKAFVSELAPIEYRAGTLGGYQMVIGLCNLPASLIAGILWDKISIFAPFYFSMGLTILSIVMLTFVNENKESSI